MIPAYARIAHKNLRATLHKLEELNEKGEFVKRIEGSSELGVITSGISFQHVRDAAPEASVLKLGFTYPLPLETIRKFAESVKRAWSSKRVTRSSPTQSTPPGSGSRASRRCSVSANSTCSGSAGCWPATPLRNRPPPPAKPPQLCAGCPHRKTYQALHELNCIVSGDIGC